MARHKPGDETAQACHAECCRAGDGCNAWNWHDVGQCHLSPKRLSPSTDECHPNGDQLVHGNAFTFGDMKIIRIAMDAEK